MRGSLALVVLLAGCVTADVLTPDVVRDLAPTGTLRVALPQSETARAVGGDVVRELVRRAGMPRTFVAPDADWDVAVVPLASPRPGGLELTAAVFVVRGVPQALAVPRGRPLAIRYLRDFVDELKASGFIAASLEKSGRRDAAVAP